MAKMFYSEEEAAAKLGVTAEEMEARAKKGEFDRLMNLGKPVYKASQIDQLVGEEGGGGGIPLADSNVDDAISLADSAAPGLKGAGETTKEKSGISIFEADELEDTSDASAQTQITGSIGGVKVGTDNSGSGSGLLDLTRDSKDDTGIGAGILGDAYDQTSKDLGATPPGGTPNYGAVNGRGSSGGGSSMFEDSGVASDVGAAAGAAAGAGMMMVAVEAIDGLSGLVGGLALGMSAVCLFAISVVFMAMGGLTGGLVGLVAANLWMVVGALALFVVICALVGWFLGKGK